MDNAGNVYVADFGNSTIRKITSAGVVSTIAGLAGNTGSADGAGSTARFSGPDGVAVDSAGNVFVADWANDTIRKITPAGVVSTIAGLAGSAGSADGMGSAARFNGPTSVAVDSSGNIYVADTYNDTIRKITAGRHCQHTRRRGRRRGSADGTGNSARFYGPEGVSVDIAGNVYVADYDNHTIRKITSAGVVSTIAGLAGCYGCADGAGSTGTVPLSLGVAIDAAGNVYVADSDNFPDSQYHSGRGRYHAGGLCERRQHRWHRSWRQVFFAVLPRGGRRR